jgi:hypothetical protein
VLSPFSSWEKVRMRGFEMVCFTLTPTLSLRERGLK